MSKHISEQYDAELASLRSQLMEMGGLVEQQLQQAGQALVNHDIALAEAVRDSDRRVNRMEVELDELCVAIIARRQPAASDLRMLISIMRAITDLERIGDESDRIAKMARGMAREAEPADRYRGFRELHEAVAAQLAAALDAFARRDDTVAEQVIGGDGAIDERYKALCRELIEEMSASPNTVARNMNTIWSARALERIGDHAKNLGEYVLYQVKGEDVRHRKLQR